MLSDLERRMKEYPWHTQYKLLNGKHNTFPISHMICEDFLHPAIFEAVREECRDISKFQPRFKNPTLTSSRYRSSWSFTKEFLSQTPKDAPARALFQSLTDTTLVYALKMIFKKEIERRHGEVPSTHSCHLEIVADRSGYALLPHVDTPQKLITCLIYLADQGQNPALGTSLYGAAPRAKHPAETNATADGKPPQHPPLSREEVSGDEARRAIQFQINLPA